MAIDLDQLRRHVSGRQVPERTHTSSSTSSLVKVSLSQHFEDCSCTWDTLWEYIIFTILVCEGVLWVGLKYKPKITHQFFEFFDHKLLHSTKELITISALVGLIFALLCFFDNFLKVLNTPRRQIMLD
jgi:hypothetical protein